VPLSHTHNVVLLSQADPSFLLDNVMLHSNIKLIVITAIAATIIYLMQYRFWGGGKKISSSKQQFTKLIV